MILSPPSLLVRTEPHLVSFLIVAFNARSFLRPCIASVFAQTYPHIELVLVNNGSTDGAIEEVLAEFGPSPALRVVRSEKNLGPSGGAMLGLAYCRGEFVARLDADDVALPDRITVQVDFLRRNSEKSAVGGDVLRIDAGGNVFGIGLSLRSEFMRRHAAKWYIGCFHTTLLVRRSALIARGYNPTLFTSGDHELIEWMARDGGLGLVPFVVCLYRQHLGSITEGMSGLQRLTGNELRQLMAEIVTHPDKRGALAVMDFSLLLDDARVRLSRPAQNRWFEDDCLKRHNWLGAAYFASINFRWPQFAGRMARAAIRETPWRELLALFLCRTLWPMRLRLAGVGVAVLRPFSRTQASGPINASFRAAALLNALRRSTRWGSVVASVLAISYFGLKPLPSARDVPWLPPKAIYFVDHYSLLCNVAAFASGTAVLQICLRGLTGDDSRACWRRSAWIAGLVVGIELVQIFLPRRVFDPMDIAAGWLGVLLATWIFLPTGRKKTDAIHTDIDEPVVGPTN